MMQKWPQPFTSGPYAGVKNPCWNYGESRSNKEGQHQCPHCGQTVIGKRVSESYVLVEPHERM